MAEIHKLFGGEPPEPTVPDENVVALLKQLLFHAESGRLRFLACAGGDLQSDLMHFAGFAQKSRIVGQLEILKTAIIDAPEV